MRVHIETELRAPAAEVWRILAHEFAEIAAWSSTVSASRALTSAELPPGVVADPRAPVSGRQTTSAFVTAREVLVAYDEAGMCFTFTALDLPFFLTRAENTSRVLALGPDSARLIFDVEMQLWGPFALGRGWMQARFTRAMRAVHADLKAYAEAARGAA